MGATEGENRFRSFQAAKVDGNVKLIQAELKEIRWRSGIVFHNLNSLIRYVAKLTGINRTTLKRNLVYRRLLMDSLARQPGAALVVNPDDASPELLRAMIEDLKMDKGNLANQNRMLVAKINQIEHAAGKSLVNNLQPKNVGLPVNVNADIAFQDTAFILEQLIQRFDGSIVVDVDEYLIIDMAILNPRERREHAIGPERTKFFINWFKERKILF
jgi:hypothetical protein